MIFLWIVIGIVLLVGLLALINWWRDERDKKLGIVTRPSMPLVSLATPLHPSIDPYLNSLREYLLQSPLPQGSGEMADRVYAHLMAWLNDSVTQDTPYTGTDDLADEMLVKPSRYVDISRNDPVLPSGQVENIKDGSEQ